jgi:hypothetical protein
VRTLGFAPPARTFGGGGRRPAPTPPSEDASVLSVFSPCLCGETAMASCAMPSCLGVFVVATVPRRIGRRRGPGTGGRRLTAPASRPDIGSRRWW